ncbi:pyridoxamine 5'-phosphate oxidase family protein [Pontixanthobacter sp. CEM42]|uniref:pyridoxamine 5'-phosphate oxidase family protein n=1 Tax=Pontixanthobacter sp. CEM42 TaxID=2792077 RepID=UPI001FD72D34|nr:pyridoxamine 5'-phosphate oxidase family protein [Pontixanthobacter sp. CEM42]
MAIGRMDISLETIADNIANHLQTGANKRKSAMHTPVVGTADGDLRVMVLREFDPVANTLRFHTDGRSPKVRAVGANPQVSVLAYDPASKVQIRMRGTGRIETDSPATDSAWLESTAFARRCYLSEKAPGVVSGQPISGLPEWAEGIAPTDDQVASGRASFAILMIDVAEYDWLYLANSGHRRARLVVGEDGKLAGNWLVP